MILAIIEMTIAELKPTDKSLSKDEIWILASFSHPHPLEIEIDEMHGKNLYVNDQND